jgi:2'-5' RNA ligase
VRPEQLTVEQLAAAAKVAEAAAQGRGLWVGIYVGVDSSSAKRPSDGLRSAALAPFHTQSLEGLHVTLAHLGKKKDAKRAEIAAEACWHVAAGWPSGPVVAATWGQARLDQYTGCVCALLLEGEAPHQLHAAVARALAHRDLTPDRTFGFHPHLTLYRHAKDAVIELRRRARQQVTFPALSLVCGDGRVDYPLGAF